MERTIHTGTNGKAAFFSLICLGGCFISLMNVDLRPHQCLCLVSLCQCGCEKVTEMAKYSHTQDVNGKVSSN